MLFSYSTDKLVFKVSTNYLCFKTKRGAFIKFYSNS